MTTNQNDTNLLTDEQLDTVAAGILLPVSARFLDTYPGSKSEEYGLGKVREKLYCIVGTGC